MRRYGIAMAVLVAAASWVAGAAAAEQEPRQVMLPRTSVTPSVAKYADGRFVLLDGAGHDLPGARFSSVSVLDGDGRELVEADGENPPPDAFRLDDAALTPDGMLVVAGWLDAGHDPVLAEYDLRSRKVARIVHTAPVGCRAIAADASGIWCVGVDIEATNARTDYDVVYRFTLAGERAQSLFRKRTDARRDRVWHSPDQLVFGGGRFVAWLPGDEELLSWGPLGDAPRRLTLAAPAEVSRSELGVLGDGTAVLLTHVGRDAEEPHRPRRALFAVGSAGGLERRPDLCLLFPAGYTPAGIDGDELVFLDRQGRRFVWMPARCADEE
jgi:hypothetical protein